MLFDAICIIVFLVLEVVYYISFRKHEEAVRDDLLAISERLELLIERIDNSTSPMVPSNHEKTSSSINGSFR